MHEHHYFHFNSRDLDHIKIISSNLPTNRIIENITYKQYAFSEMRGGLEERLHHLERKETLDMFFFFCLIEPWICCVAFVTFDPTKIEEQRRVCNKTLIKILLLLYTLVYSKANALTANAQTLQTLKSLKLCYALMKALK